MKLGFMNLINRLHSKLKNSENWLWKALWQNVVSPFANQIHLWLPRCWNIYLKTLQIWSVLLALGGNDLYWGPDILSDITWDVIDLLCIFRKVENMIYNLLSGFWSHDSLCWSILKWSYDCKGQVTSTGPDWCLGCPQNFFFFFVSAV